MGTKTKETSERAVRIRIRSVQYDYRDSLSERIAEMQKKAEELLHRLDNGETNIPADDGGEELYDERSCGDAGEPVVMVTEGRLRSRGNLCELSYMEADENELGQTKTTLVFSKARPEVVTLTREGAMRMTLSFEEGRHHIGTYHIGALQSLFADHQPLSIASYARKVQNRIVTDGTLELDYMIEVRGMDTQRTVFSLQVDDLPLVPHGFEGGDSDV